MKQITFKAPGLPINYQTNEIGNHDNDPAKIPLEENVFKTDDDVRIIIQTLFNGFFEIMEKEIKILKNIQARQGLIRDVEWIFSTLPSVTYVKSSLTEENLIAVCLTSQAIIDFAMEQMNKIFEYIAIRSDLILGMFKKEFPVLEESRYELPRNEQVMKILNDLEMWGRFIFVSSSTLAKLAVEHETKSKLH